MHDGMIKIFDTIGIYRPTGFPEVMVCEGDGQHGNRSHEEG